jgi:hypothetical protein
MEIRNMEQIMKSIRIGRMALVCSLLLGGIGIAAAAELPRAWQPGMEQSSGRAMTELPNGHQLTVDASGTWLDKTKVDGIDRRHASVTVIPTGEVLIWGGIDASGSVIKDGRLFDPSCRVLVIRRRCSRTDVC